MRDVEILQQIYRMRTKKDLEVNHENQFSRGMLVGILLDFDLGITTSITSLPTVSVTVLSNDIFPSIPFVYSEKCHSVCYVICRYQL